MEWDTLTVAQLRDECQASVALPPAGLGARRRLLARARVALGPPTCPACLASAPAALLMLCTLDRGPQVRNLATKGLKQDLIDRLRQWDADTAKEAEQHSLHEQAAAEAAAAEGVSPTATHVAQLHAAQDLYAQLQSMEVSPAAGAVAGRQGVRTSRRGRRARLRGSRAVGRASGAGRHAT